MGEGLTTGSCFTRLNTRPGASQVNAMKLESRMHANVVHRGGLESQGAVGVFKAEAWSMELQRPGWVTHP